MSNEIKKTVKDVSDAIHEGAHKGKADAEHEERSEFGDVMTPGEKAGSAAREVSEEAKAAVDRAKRKARDAT